MCGRYSITTPVEAMRLAFDFEGSPNLAPRYNVAPTQSVPVVRAAEPGGRVLVTMHWGLVPHWAKERTMAAKMINAQAESVARKPAYRQAFARRRCLVPADGFYEWMAQEGGKQPYRIARADGAVFAFAGLWERWQEPGAGVLESCTIVTTMASPELRPIHARMPVILAPEAYAPWLEADAKRDADRLAALMAPRPTPELTATRVSTRVNNVRNDDPDCLTPLGEETGAQGALL